MDAIIVDTSSIVFAAGNGIDVFAAILEQMPGTAIMVSRGVINELERLAGPGSKKGKAARLGLRILRAHRVDVLRDDGYVDSWIERESAGRKCWVCTNDRALKGKLKGLGVRVASVSPKGILR